MIYAQPVSLWVPWPLLGVAMFRQPFGMPAQSRGQGTLAGLPRARGTAAWRWATADKSCSELSKSELDAMVYIRTLSGHFVVPSFPVFRVVCDPRTR